jgi:tRNA-specific 2-thiouridylase
MTTQKTVVVGMSGGVDSSVAAWLLKQQGYRVIGLFMKNWEDDDTDEYCSTRQDLIDAVSAAEVVGIDIEVVNFAKEYKERVFSYFLEEYQKARTPNPDILCNSEIKFDCFLSHALKLGADHIATGHYARVSLEQTSLGKQLDGKDFSNTRRNDQDQGVGSARVEIVQNVQRDSEQPTTRRLGDAASGAEVFERFVLKKALDLTKDQSYFLHRLNQQQLSKTLFPLGEMPKTQVRQLAQQIGLANAAKKDSTGICFIGERPFREFLSKYLPHQAGEMRDVDSQRVVGKHVGLAFYTLGQRKGLGLGGQKDGPGKAWYSVRKDLKQNILWVAQGDDHPALWQTQLTCEQPHWILGLQPEPASALSAKTRYRQPDHVCHVQVNESGAANVRFDQAQWAITAGQSVVFYQGDWCLGGGVID